LDTNDRPHHVGIEGEPAVRVFPAGPALPDWFDADVQHGAAR
jgi:hypothetical protein